MATDELDFERSYWGSCVNTFDEDQKHYVYARFMDLPRHHYSFDAQDRSILDIGGGPSSMLLKCINLRKGKVIDPIEYPEWTRQRYLAHSIEVEVNSGENADEQGWDEVWIYNCLQHVHDVAKIIDNAKKAAPVLRIFEWIDIPAHEGHPIELTRQYLDSVIGLPGSGVVTLSESGCYGRAYYGVFDL